MCYDLKIRTLETYPVFLLVHHVRTSSERCAEKFTLQVHIIATSLLTKIMILEVEHRSEPFFVPLHRKLRRSPLIDEAHIEAADLGFGSLEGVKILRLRTL